MEVLCIIVLVLLAIAKGFDFVQERNDRLDREALRGAARKWGEADIWKGGR